MAFVGAVGLIRAASRFVQLVGFKSLVEAKIKRD